MDLHKVPIEAIEAELKLRRSTQIAEYRARKREHELAIDGLEKELKALGQPVNATRRRKARA